MSLTTTRPRTEADPSGYSCCCYASSGPTLAASRRMGMQNSRLAVRTLHQNDRQSDRGSELVRHPATLSPRVHPNRYDGSTITFFPFSGSERDKRTEYRDCSTHRTTRHLRSILSALGPNLADQTVSSPGPFTTKSTSLRTKKPAIGEFEYAFPLGRYYLPWSLLPCVNHSSYPLELESPSDFLPLARANPRRARKKKQSAWCELASWE